MTDRIAAELVMPPAREPQHVVTVEIELEDIACLPATLEDRADEVRRHMGRYADRLTPEELNCLQTYVDQLERCRSLFSAALAKAIT